MRKIISYVAAAVMVGLSFFGAGCEEKKDKSQENAMLAASLVIAANSETGFSGSCVSGGSSDSCFNFYGESQAQTYCEENFLGTFATSKCSCTNVVGVCSLPFVGATAETVYYSGDVIFLESNCVKSKGTFSIDCTE